MIYLIVEGDGEVSALPVLLRRLLPELGVYVGVGLPIKQNRSDLVIEHKLKHALEIVLRKPDIQAVLILFDADDACARDCIPQIRRWAQETSAHIPCAVVMARREYEAWFLGSVESLRGVRRIRDDASYPSNPETRRGAKWLLSEFMPKDAPYRETADQPALSDKFSFQQAYQRASSFRKLVSELCRVLMELGHQPTIPVNWLVGEGGE